MYDNLTTIRDYWRFAVSQFEAAHLFYGHGTDNAWDEARYLIWNTLHLPFENDALVLDAKLTESEKALLTTRIERRVKDHIPVAYLTNRAYFAGLPFYVDERVIFRDHRLGNVLENRFAGILKEAPEYALDLCTGSGCIAIALALAFPGLKVDPWITIGMLWLLQEKIANIMDYWTFI